MVARTPATLILAAGLILLLGVAGCCPFQAQCEAVEDGISASDVDFPGCGYITYDVSIINIEFYGPGDQVCDCDYDGSVVSDCRYEAP